MGKMDYSTCATKSKNQGASGEQFWQVEQYIYVYMYISALQLCDAILLHKTSSSGIHFVARKSMERVTGVSSTLLQRFDPWTRTC